MRKEPLANGNYYHIFNRSIAHYEIFKRPEDCARFMQIIDFYRFTDIPCKYSNFLELTEDNRQAIIQTLNEKNHKHVKIVAFCIMPTHFHLIVYQNNDDGILKYMTNILNSYSRYFNLRYKRKGPLWEGHFKRVLVGSDEQSLHLSRYIHLNPVTADIVKKPEAWSFSSYDEYINKNENGLCEFKNLIAMSPEAYKEFVNNQISYQKELSKIKHILLEDDRD